MWTDRWTQRWTADKKREKLIVAFLNFANAPKYPHKEIKTSDFAAQ
jgi:hypothetical protein